MNVNYVKGVGLILKAGWEVTDQKYKEALADLLTGLGLLGVHLAILDALKTSGVPAA